jgi:hypothetical protein
MGSISDVSEIYAASIFRIGMFLKNRDGKSGVW